MRLLFKVCARELCSSDGEIHVGPHRLQFYLRHDAAAALEGHVVGPPQHLLLIVSARHADDVVDSSERYFRYVARAECVEDHFAKLGQLWQAVPTVALEDEARRAAEGFLRPAQVAEPGKITNTELNHVVDVAVKYSTLYNTIQHQTDAVI